MNNSDPYYPVNDKKNNEKLAQYEKLCKLNNRFIFGGRLAEYRYYDMDQTIASSLKKYELTCR